MNLFKKTNRAIKIWQTSGWRGVWQRTAFLSEKRTEKRTYQKWIAANRLSDTDRAEFRRQIENFSSVSLISVVLPVYDVDEKWLRRCIESVLKQIYRNWELCIADDCSPSPHIKRILREYAARDERIKVVYRETNGHISAASNSALSLATGDFTALLDHDDELSEDALFWIAKEINDFPETQMIYSDEDLIDEQGRRYSPKFKPEWSRDLFYSLNLITHLSAYRTDVLRKINGWRIGSEGSQDYDLALRVIEHISEKNIRHIPRILYHWRAIRGSVALSGDEKPYAHERAREAIRGHLERTGKRAEVSRTVYNLHRTRYALPSPPAAVELIILAAKDSSATRRAVQVFSAGTDYRSFEIVLVCSPAAAERFGDETRAENAIIIVCEEESAAAKYNAAVRQTNGEILCFVNADLRPAMKDWLKELAGFASQTEIGAAGAKILDANETILHGGTLLGMNGLIGAAHGGLPNRDGGNMARAQVINNYSATTVDCLATSRRAFQAVGGFDAKHLPNQLFDVDFCLKLREKNLRVVWTPYAELHKIERGKPLSFELPPSVAEREFFEKKWRAVIERDPFYNPNFSKRGTAFRLKV